MSKINVALIYGGQSSEHSVSCVTAGAVLSQLDPERFTVFPIGITRDGVWTVGEHDPAQLRTVDRRMPEVELKEEVVLSTNPTTPGRILLRNGEEYARVDVIFPVVHGQNGEDGTLQGLFELSGVPYVGCGVVASACGMDKEFTRTILRAKGLPIGYEVVLQEGEALSDAERGKLGLPVFVKPARGGSSIGITKVSNWEEFDQALEVAFAEDTKVIVESEIVGSEIECGVLEQPDGLLASVPAKLVGTDSGDEGFYGFETKYLDNVVSAEIPADIGPEATAEIQALAKKAFRALQCKGLARVDFFLTAQGPMINEINTMPGFTPISMYPKVLAASGVSYPELLSTLIDNALSSRPKQ